MICLGESPFRKDTHKESMYGCFVLNHVEHSEEGHTFTLFALFALFVSFWLIPPSVDIFFSFCETVSLIF